MKKILITFVFLFLLPVIPVMAAELPEIATQDVTIGFQGTREGEAPYCEVFQALDEAQFLVWLRECNDTDKKEYQFPDYICVDFSYDLRDSFYTDYGFHGVYTICDILKPGGHSMNAILIGNDPYLTTNWLIIEPQDDNCWVASEFLYPYPFRIFFYYPESVREYIYICGYVISKDEVIFFTNKVDIEEWLEEPSCPTYADWLYNSFIALT